LSVENPLLNPEARDARAMRLRRALYRTYELSGLNQDRLAPIVNLSPPDLSRSIAPIPNPDAEQRRRFPAEQVANLMLGANRQDFLEALIEEMGYDPARLQEIKRAVKTPQQVDEELLAEVKGIKVAMKGVEEKLVLRNQVAGGLVRKK
jgi:hypothetical protein